MAAKTRIAEQNINILVTVYGSQFTVHGSGIGQSYQEVAKR
jgi:hypothetical protein